MMGLAYVICKRCRSWVVFGDERWWENSPVCEKCYRECSDKRAQGIEEGKAALPVVTKKRRKRRKKKKKVISMEIDPDELDL